MKPARRLTAGISLLALAATVSFLPAARASPPHHLFPLSRTPHAPWLPPYVDRNPATKSGIWTDLADGGPFELAPETALLMTDGTVVVHDVCQQWYRLSPDIKGRYETGTWSALPKMPNKYGPFYFASEILPDGRLIVNGGEYNGPTRTCSGGSWTNKGALYDPVANRWTTVLAPAGWKSIGDASSLILGDGNYMLADCCNKYEAIAKINGTTLTWKTTGRGKADSNSEEGWSLLPDGKVMTVDTNINVGENPNSVEIYDRSTGSWSAAGTTAQQLVSSGNEIGPSVLRPDGNLIWFGATGHNDVYSTATATWSAGPDFPSGYDCNDAPAALLPSGNVLVQSSPGVANIPSHFFEFSISAKGAMSLTQVNDPATAPRVSSYEGRLLDLPTGQVLWTNTGELNLVPNEIATYTPKGTPKPEWLPSITSVATTLAVGSTENALAGRRFNGFSQGAAFGDDAQMATNYPLVRITNTATGDVCFARTYNFSTMGVWTTGVMNALFDLPSSCETGAGTFQVIVNGLASPGVAVTLN